MVNAVSTREEVTLFFGTNQTWNPGAAAEFEVKLSDRIVLSPFAAKRLWLLMGAVLQEHEKRFGALDLGAATTPGAQVGAASADSNNGAAVARRQSRISQGIAFPPYTLMIHSSSEEGALAMSQGKDRNGRLLARRPGKKTWMLMGLVAMVGGWLLHEYRESVEYEILTDRYSDDPLKYERLGQPAFYRLTFRATVNDEPIRIVRVGECRPYLASGGMGGGYWLQHVVVPPFAGERLPDGSAFYIKMPDYCLRLKGKDGRKQWSSIGTEEVLPQAYWVDDIEAPTVIEYYMVAAYFDQPGARARIDEGRVEFLPTRPETLPQGGPADAVLGKPGPTGVTLGASESVFGSPGFGRIFGRLKFVPVDPRWRDLLNAPPIAVSTSGRFKVYLKKDADVNPDLIEGGSRLFYNQRALSTYLGRLIAGVPLNFPPDLLRTLPGRAKEEIQVAAEFYASVVPVLPVGENRFVIDLRRKGYEVATIGRPRTFSLTQNYEKVTFVFNGDPLQVEALDVNLLNLIFLDTQDDRVYVLTH